MKDILENKLQIYYTLTNPHWACVLGNNPFGLTEQKPVSQSQLMKRYGLSKLFAHICLRFLNVKCEYQPVLFSGSLNSTSSSLAGAERPFELKATATRRKRTSHSRPRTVHDGSSEDRFTLTGKETTNQLNTKTMMNPWVYIILNVTAVSLQKDVALSAVSTSSGVQICVQFTARFATYCKRHRRNWRNESAFFFNFRYMEFRCNVRSMLCSS